MKGTEEHECLPGRAQELTEQLGLANQCGLISLAETLAIELGGDDVRVNAIAPGAVGGERMQRVLAGRAEAAGTSLDEARGNMLAMQSLKRFVDPKDIAALCVFLASDAATSISGTSSAGSP